MKVRLGFVSNSSSSSFVCEVCGDSIEAIAEALDDVKYSIENGEFCNAGVYFGERVTWKLNVNQR